MVIVGAKGFAKEVLEILYQRNELNNVFFFDNISNDLPDRLYERFPVLCSIQEVKQVFEKTGDRSFALGLGNPVNRHALNKLFTEAGGILKSTISTKADIGSFGTIIGAGCNILSCTVVTNNVTIGAGCLINPNCTVSHDSVIGDFVEMSPGARITGNCRVDSFSVLGTNSVVLPRVKLGKNVIVGACAVVTGDVPDNSLVAGVPAVLKRKLQALTL